MELLECNENRSYRLTKDELRLALAAFIPVPATFMLDDADISHDGPTFTLTCYFTRPLNEP